MARKQQIIGYTTGVYDMFHIGHLNMLRNAKALCDKLVVGVTVDELVKYKGKECTIPFEQRIEIVRNIKCVDMAIPQYDMDKAKACKKLKASILFVGDDWHDTDKWNQYEKDLKEQGVEVIYFPYTKDISSTMLQQKLSKKRSKCEK